MENNIIRALLNDVHNVFFHKWRDRVPDPDSDEWETIVQEVSALEQKYGNNERANQLILWFLDELDERSRKGVGER